MTRQMITRVLSKLASFLLILGGPFAAAANAASIGVQFFGNDQNLDGRQAVALAPTDVAGLVPQSNYNVFSNLTEAAAPLNDDSGALSGATLSYTGPFTRYAAVA